MGIATALGQLALASAAAPSSYTGGDTSGCGKTHYFNGITQYRTVETSGGDRSYGIHVPLSYDKDHQYPLIVGFHGSSSIGFFLEADSRLSWPEYTSDQIMVYPDGIGGAWAGASYSEASAEEDLQFVWDLLKDIRENFCIDSARIYATGMSMGGGFVNTIACNATVGAEFAAFAPASGAFYTDNDANHDLCEPARVPVPMLEIHGGADADVDYNGGKGEGGQLPSIPTWLSRWSERNECDPDWDQKDLFDGDVHRLSWTCQGRKGTMLHYMTEDQKHCWASPLPNFSQLAAGDGPTHIDASRIIVDFFMSFRRPAE